MTAQPTRDQLLDMTERLGFLGDRPDLCDEVVDGLWSALDRADHRIARLEAQTDIRGRAVKLYQTRAREAEARIRDLTQEVQDERGAALDQMEQVRIRDARIAEEKHLRMEATAAATKAEARIKAVEDVLDNPIHLTDWDDPLVPAERIRRALEG